MRINPTNLSFTGVELGQRHLPFTAVGNQTLANNKRDQYTAETQQQPGR